DSANFRKDPAGQEQCSVHVGSEPHISGEENDRRSFSARRPRSDRGTVDPVGDDQDPSSRMVLLAANPVLLRDNQNARRVRPATGIEYAEANDLQEIPRTGQDPSLMSQRSERPCQAIGPGIQNDWYPDVLRKVRKHGRLLHLDRRVALAREASVDGICQAWILFIGAES